MLDSVCAEVTMLDAMCHGDRCDVLSESFIAGMSNMTYLENEFFIFCCDIGRGITCNIHTYIHIYHVASPQGWPMAAGPVSRLGSRSPGIKQGARL